MRQFLDQLSRYLGLIGLTALFIGGLGVGTSIHAFLRDKLRTIAILKAVGADSATVARLRERRADQVCDANAERERVALQRPRG